MNLLKITDLCEKHIMEIFAIADELVEKSKKTELSEKVAVLFFLNLV